MFSFIWYPYYTTFGFPDKLFQNSYVIILLSSECFHLINICLKFFRAFREREGDDIFVVKFDRVWRHYLQGEFIIDIIILLPFGLVGSIHEDLSPFRLLWFLKLYRIKSTFDIVDGKFYNPILRKYHQNRLDGIIADEERSISTSKDWT